MRDRNRRGIAWGGAGVGTGERVVRGVIALLVASVGVTMLPTNPVAAVAIGLVTIGIMTMAVTGSCPVSWLRARRRQASQPFAFDDARALVDITTTSAKRTST